VNECKKRYCDCISFRIAPTCSSVQQISSAIIKLHCLVCLPGFKIKNGNLLLLLSGLLIFLSIASIKDAKKFISSQTFLI